MKSIRREGRSSIGEIVVGKYEIVLRKYRLS